MENIKKKAGRPTKEEKILRDNEKLKKELEQLRQQLEVKVQEDEAEIKQNKYIRVISLNYGLLVLSTEGRGRGKIYKFEKFGDVRNIVYSDLANIIHNQQSFAEQGRFYILDKQVVKNHGLIEYYEKLMNKDTIDKLLTFDKDKIIELLNNTTETQRENIVGILIKKIRNNENVDLNKIDIVSRAVNKNIYEIAKENLQE